MSQIDLEGLFLLLSVIVAGMFWIMQQTKQGFGMKQWESVFEDWRGGCRSLAQYLTPLFNINTPDVPGLLYSISII